MSPHRRLPLILLIVFSFAIGRAQDKLHTELFGETDQVLNQAKEKHADLLSPSNFAKGMDYYNEASNLFKGGRNLEDIRDKLKNATAYLAKALDNSYIGEELFAKTMTARGDAGSAGAPKSYPDLWKKAEEQFNKAARQLEDGNQDDAKGSGMEAEQSYRTAELEAIKLNYLAPARDLLKRAEDENVSDRAPKTLEKAKQLTLQVENLLKQKRQSNDEAGRLAQEAKYEAAHAIYLSQKIAQMRDQDKKYEDAILEAESGIARIASAFGTVPRFDAGYDAPVSTILEQVKMRKADSDSTISSLRNLAIQNGDSIRQLHQTVAQREDEIANLKQQVNSMQSRVGSLTDAEKDLQHRLQVQHEQEETIRQLNATFTEDEGNVLRDGDNFMIRLYGLTFSTGKNTIESQYYPLLTKVQNAIKQFPNCRVTIEGHTDSQGRKETNQKLSDARAKAVAEYLMANMNVTIPINSQGFGDSKPVTSNTTPEGRAKNRRIDVIITPEWALTGK